MKAVDDIYDITMYNVKDTEEERVFGNVLYREEEEVHDSFIERLAEEYLELGVYTHLGIPFDRYCKQNKASHDLITKALTKYKEKMSNMKSEFEDMDLTKMLKE